jgi:hypothetical protein
MEDYTKNIGKCVKKDSKPFKSGRKINTVKDVIEHPILFVPAYTFKEDDSYVECRRCVVVCGYDIAWIGKCTEPAGENGRCEKHAKAVCCSCGKPATHDCPETGQLVCGAPLCDDCEHTTAMEGTNGNIGFFRTSPLPEGMREHCKKADQKVFPWYVTSMKKDYPYFVEVLDKFDKGELTYLEADKLILDFIVEKNRIEEELEKAKNNGEEN